MKTFELHAALAAGLLLLAAATGAVTTSLGRPLNPVVSTVHKLLAVGSVVFAVFLAVDAFKIPGVGSALVVPVVAGAMLFVATFATGALLSSDKLVSVALRSAHAVIPFATMLSVVALAWLGLRRAL
jgi:hypothetical protein